MSASIVDDIYGAIEKLRAAPVVLFVPHLPGIDECSGRTHECAALSIKKEAPASIVGWRKSGKIWLLDSPCGVRLHRAWTYRRPQVHR